MKTILVKNDDKLMAIKKNVTTNKGRVIWNKNMNLNIPYYKKFIDGDVMENLVNVLKKKKHEISFFEIIAFASHEGSVQVRGLYPEIIQPQVYVAFATKSEDSKLISISAKRPSEYSALGWHDTFGLTVPVIFYRDFNDKLLKGVNII